MKKFGKILNSRPAGREAVLRAKQIVNGSAESNGLVLDLSEVTILTPSFADEFVAGLKDLYPDTSIKIQGYKDNVVIKDTLKALNLI